ncbi:hypothetical protein [Pseudobacteriovorax antillogorgiicola]|uniref:Outer membrane protein beta-barrel domain-containing protein n=1 Tax=Pseudobacteriovorax antillogorgiicola TaxID=1513793 RepID=A0A1Y6BNE2_9BACT|nr:hypothetical protein [Pseudobacteriovorax antillogorgiicola]TCS54523.1 hypothetical protein EDD56_10636 [Pseudobacteriovorax antillogorgiicola]SMF18817.1 hypothetical protein SAMN06296036_106207 [Pseudobacteriovorax antillogorgiicola]
MRFVFHSLFFLLITDGVMAHTSNTRAGRFTGALFLMDTEYENENNTEFDVEGQMLVGGMNTMVSPQFTVGGGLGLLIDGELGNALSFDDGSGFRIFFDGRYMLKKAGAIEFAMTGNLTHDRFTFESGDTELDWSMTDLKLGGLAIHRAGRASIYGGLDAVLYSDGQSEVGDASADAERNDRINLRVGGSFALDRSMDLRADIFLLGEKSIQIGVDMYI